MIKLTINQVRSRANDNSFQRGQSYYHNDALTDLARRGNDIEAFCQGSEVRPYRVSATLDDKGIVSTSCTCEYAFGGDCKHIVALLLAYVAEPESFVERPDLKDTLANRSREELVELIQQMLKRYPDLHSIVERPVPGKKASSQQPQVNTDSLRREIRWALKQYPEWGDNTTVDTVYSVKENGDAFAQQDDWHNAHAIYRAILEEVTTDVNAYYTHDEEGDLSIAIEEVLNSLESCLSHLKEDTTERQTILKAMLDFVIWSLDELETDLAADTPDVILQYARTEDIPLLRPPIIAARDSKRHNQWELEAYESLLANLDMLNNDDPEIMLQRLRDGELYNVLFEKLMDLGRAEEAIAVVRDHLTDVQRRLTALPRLVEAGYYDTAVELARDLLKQSERSELGWYHYGIVSDWLLDIYQVRGDYEAYFELQRDGMRKYPSIEYYRELKTAAEKVSKWETAHADVIRQLEKARQWDVLTQVYLEDENWDAAWETVTKVPEKRNFGGLVSPRELELDVAEQTRFTHPHKAIPVYIKHVRLEIDHRNRDNYRQAATYLSILRDLYRKVREEDKAKQLIADIRAEFRRLPALQDELNQARL